MARSLRKGPNFSARLKKKVDKAKKLGKSNVGKIWARAEEILPFYTGMTFEVHNGRNHIAVYITEDMIGHKFGEFAPTRTYRGHSGNNKKGK